MGISSMGAHVAMLSPNGTNNNNMNNMQNSFHMQRNLANAGLMPQGGMQQNNDGGRTQQMDAKHGGLNSLNVWH